MGPVSLAACYGLTQSLTDEFIRGMVAKDNLRGKNRFQLGLFAPGKTSNSTQLVIRLTPTPSLGASTGPCLARSLWNRRLNDQKVIVFIDNQGVLDACIKGFARVPWSKLIVGEFVLDEAECFISSEPLTTLSEPAAVAEEQGIMVRRVTKGI